MAVGIECPVCEAVFLVKQVNTKTGIRCPECNRKFRFSKEVLAKQSAEQLASKTKSADKTATAKRSSTADAATEEPPEKRARFKTKSKRKAPASANSVATEDQSPEPVAGSSSEKIDLSPNASSSLSLIQMRKKLKQRQQVKTTIATVVILSIAIVVLGVLLYRQLYLLPPPEQQASETSSVSNPDKPDLLKPDVSEQGPWLDNFENPADEITEPDDLDDVEVELPRVLADDLPKREFEFLRKPELRAVWQRIRPRLVSLKVRTDLGAMPSVGVIVDSRGWVLTSNQLVSKWPDVSVTAAARDVDAYYDHVDAQKQAANDGAAGASQTLLTDVSKGIVSSQPNRDQALIAINTRFVVSLDKFEFAPRVVAGSFLVQVAPPSPTNPYGFEEVEVFQRQEFDELETEARTKAEALGIVDPLANWIVCSKKADPVVGTPVVTRTGQLAGTYVFSTKQFAYFLMTNQTVNLIAQAAESGTAGGPPQQVSPVTELLSEKHPMARSCEAMNRSGAACEAFGWIPTDTDQYKQLQQFSRRFSIVVKFIQEQQDNPSESVSLSILSDQVSRWEKSISPIILKSNIAAPEKIDQLNAIAIDKLNVRRPNTANTYVPFVGEVYSAGLDSDGLDSVLIMIGEGQAIVKVPFSRATRRMRPGSKWLVFYKRPSLLDRSKLSLSSGEPISLFEDGKVLLFLGPIQKTR